MEYAEWSHLCKDCGHVESRNESHCYGQGNEYGCLIGGCKNTFET